MIGADTLRADALGLYGAEPTLTPALDELGRESDVWSNAYATFNVTVPSFASIMTGLYGKHHGVYDNDERLSDGLVTLAELLGQHGYSTGAFLSARHLYTARLGQGFQTIPAPRAHQVAELAVNQAIQWVQETEPPFFLWVHLYDPHTPHTPPGRFGGGYLPTSARGLQPPRRWRTTRAPGPILFDDWVLMGHRALYEGEVAYLDRQVDRLVDYLRSRDRLRHTTVIFVADHGENLHDHGLRYRHAGLWETVVRVPLMIRWAGGKSRGRVIRGLVQTLDLFPTILASAGVQPHPSSGRSLRELAETGGRLAVFAEQHNRRGAMIRTQRMKYFNSRFEYFLPAGAYLYDLEEDPGEAANLAGRAPRLEKRLATAVADWLSESAPEAGTTAPPLGPEDLEELRSLGYVE